MVLYALSIRSMRGALAGRRDQSHSKLVSINIRRTRSQKSSFAERSCSGCYAAYCLGAVHRSGACHARGQSVHSRPARAPLGGRDCLARWFLRRAGIPLGVEGLRAPAAGTLRGRRQSCELHRRHRRRGRLAARLRLCHQERDGARAAGRVCCCGASARPSSSASTGTRAASDARRVWKLAATGQSLVFFPEGTFDGTRQVGKFLGGAFATAERSDMPIVAVAIHGTREVLPTGGDQGPPQRGSVRDLGGVASRRRPPAQPRADRRGRRGAARALEPARSRLGQPVLGRRPVPRRSRQAAEPARPG